MVTEEEGEGFEPIYSDDAKIVGIFQYDPSTPRAHVHYCILLDAMKIFFYTLSPSVAYFLCQQSTHRRKTAILEQVIL